MYDDETTGGHIIGSDATRDGRKHRPDYKLCSLAGYLFLSVSVVLFAISPYQIHRLNETGGQVSESHYMLKQTLYLAAGAAAFVAAAMIPLMCGVVTPDACGSGDTDLRDAGAAREPYTGRWRCAITGHVAGMTSDFFVIPTS